MLEEISLSPARPTLESGTLFARYLDTSADGLVRLIFGTASEPVIAKAFLEPGHDLSFEHVTFAVQEDSVVGMVSAYSSEQHGGSSTEPLIRAAGWRIVRVGTFIVLVGRLLHFLNDIPNGDFYLQAVAVNPESQGKGVGTMLFEQAQTQARDSAADRLMLHVAVENTAARRLYEHLGMHVEATSPRLSPLPGVQVHRMVKPL